MKGPSVPIPSWPWWLLGSRKGKEKVSGGTEALKFSTKISPAKGRIEKREIKRNELELESFGSSGSEAAAADGPEWSVGWTEPHGPDFQSDDEGDNGFLVLVPCYRAVVESSNNQFLSAAVKNFPNGLSPDGKTYMEQWLASLQNL